MAWNRSTQWCGSLLVAATASLWAGMAAGGEVIADYRDDYLTGSTMPTANGWTYEWNKNGAIGTAANYANLVWGVGGNSFYATADYYAGYPGRYLSLSAAGGHPGAGTAEAQSRDYFAIASYTVQPGEEGYLAITDSWIQRSDTDTTTPRTGVELRIYVDNALRCQAAYEIDGAMVHGFNTLLGDVTAGQVIRVAVGPYGQSWNDGFTWDFTIRRIGGESDMKDLDGFRSAYQQTTPKSGWQYLWNKNGVIGNPANYAALEWDSDRYDTDANGKWPDLDTPGRYLRLKSDGGSPGQEATTGNAYDRYVIVAYTIPSDGEYVIRNATFQVNQYNGNTSDPERDDLLVHVNTDSPVLHFTANYGDGEVAWNTYLGELAANDKVYVAVGPHESESYDAFLYDFTFSRIVSARGTVFMLR
jgi:hypothetical protein